MSKTQPKATIKYFAFLTEIYQVPVAEYLAEQVEAGK